MSATNTYVVVALEFNPPNHTIRELEQASEMIVAQKGALKDCDIQAIIAAAGDVHRNHFFRAIWATIAVGLASSAAHIEKIVELAKIEHDPEVALALADAAATRPHEMEKVLFALAHHSDKEVSAASREALLQPDIKRPNLRHLREWADWDGAAFFLGVILGLWPDCPQSGGQDPWCRKKWILWTDNPTGRFLFDTLDRAVELGILEFREEPDRQYRWNPEFRGIWEKSGGQSGNATAAELARDRLLYGNSFERDGQRVDPRHVVLKPDGTYEVKE